jgi:hypothetical protein
VKKNYCIHFARHHLRSIRSSLFVLKVGYSAVTEPCLERLFLYQQKIVY